MLEQRFEVQVNQAAPWDKKISVVQYDGRREVARITTSLEGLPILGAAIAEAVVKLKHPPPPRPQGSWPARDSNAPPPPPRPTGKPPYAGYPE